MASETLSFDVFANDRASETFRRLGLAASNASGDVRTLGDRLDKLGTRVASARVKLDGDKEANAELDKLDVKLIRLGRKVADPNITVEGKIRALADIAAVDLAMDRLSKKSARVPLLSRLASGAAKSGFVQPSVLGTVAALSPALIPVAGALSGAVAGIAASFGAAAIGAGAFGLLAKSALTQAGTAASAVETAQNQYKASLVAIHQQYAANAAAATTHAQKAAALATEQKALTAAGIAQAKAINLAYAQMTPAQVKLAKSVDGLSNAWQKVQQQTTPVISGALVPWMRDVSLLMKDLAPLIRPVADLFGYWGQVLHRYLSSGAGSTEIKKIADELGRFSAAQLSNIINFVVDIGKGVANLGRDLAGHNVDFYAFGKHLQGWGDAFANWSKSAGARTEVGSFLKYIRDNGGRLTSIVQDIAKYVPGIFAGTTTAGTLELQALTGFLNLLAKLPPGIARPLTEVAGAMLLLSKTGVVKVGLQLTGKLAEHPQAFGFTLGAVLAGAIIAGVNSKRAGHGGQTWWQSFGPPSKPQQQTWLNSWAGLGDRIVFIARHDIGGGVAVAWDHLWNNTVGRAIRGGHDTEAEFSTWRHHIAAIFDGVRHDVSHAWDMIWNNTIARVRGGINDVVGLFQGLPGRALGALRGLGHSLFAFGHAALSEFWSGLKSVGGSILGWFSGFGKSVIGVVRKVLGIFSPSSVFFGFGKNLMEGMKLGVQHGAHSAVAAAAAAAHRVSAAGAGVQRWAGLVSRALAMEGLSPMLLGRVLFQMQTESGGNPNAINLTDCLTLDYVILTRRGWLTWDNVRPGDETIGYNPQTQRSEWTLVTRVVRYDDAEVWRIGNKHWHADVTPNHRWWSDTLTRAQPVFETCPECGWLPRGSQMPSRGVQVHRRKIHGIARARGPLNNLRGEFIRTADLRAGHRIRLAATADTDGIPGLSLDEARILAWLQGDGTISSAFAKPETCPECGWLPGTERHNHRPVQPGNSVAVHRAKKHGMTRDRTHGELAGYDGIIWQSKPAQIIKLRALLATVEHTETVRQRDGNTQPARAFRLRRAYVTDLLKRSQLMETGPEAFVLALSPDQRAAWLDSMIDAEGHRQPVPAAGGKRRGGSGEFIRIAQINGPLQDAIKLAVFLEGYRPTFSALPAERHGHKPSGHVGLARPHIAPSMFAPPEVLGRQPVWCVTTGLGTWTARGGDGLPFLTGNSNAAAGDPSRGLLPSCRRS